MEMKIPIKVARDMCRKERGEETRRGRFKE
jgi:hypothetical protein